MPNTNKLKARILNLIDVFFVEFKHPSGPALCHYCEHVNDEHHRVPVSLSTPNFLHLSSIYDEFQDGFIYPNGTVEFADSRLSVDITLDEAKEN